MGGFPGTEMDCWSLRTLDPVLPGPRGDEWCEPDDCERGVLYFSAIRSFARTQHGHSVRTSERHTQQKHCFRFVLTHLLIDTIQL